MKAKFEQLMQKENLTAGKLAEMLEIQPAVISHLRAGRNKPSYDVIQKILRRFPQINPDWLLLDSEEMYREGYKTPDGETDRAANLFSSTGTSEQDVDSAEQPAQEMPEILTSRESNISEPSSEWSGISDSRTISKIERVIVFYADGTFQDFRKR